MPRGNIRNLRATAAEVFEKVASTRGGFKCGRSPRGAKGRVCLATYDMSKQFAGIRCGYNKITKLFGCAETSASSGRRRKRG